MTSGAAVAAERWRLTPRDSIPSFHFTGEVVGYLVDVDAAVRVRIRELEHVLDAPRGRVLVDGER